MARTPLKLGLFARMLALCILVAGLCAALVTVAFYSYRTAVTTNRLATELSAQAYATAPVVAASLADGNEAGAARILRVFGGLGPLNAISDYVLHQFDKNREDIPDLRPVAGVVFQTFSQGVPYGEKNVLGHIA